MGDNFVLSDNRGNGEMKKIITSILLTTTCCFAGENKSFPDKQVIENEIKYLILYYNNYFTNYREITDPAEYERDRFQRALFHILCTLDEDYFKYETDIDTIFSNHELLFRLLFETEKLE